MVERKVIDDKWWMGRVSEYARVCECGISQQMVDEVKDVEMRIAKKRMETTEWIVMFVQDATTVKRAFP